MLFVGFVGSLKASESDGSSVPSGSENPSEKAGDSSSSPIQGRKPHSATKSPRIDPTRTQEVGGHSFLSPIGSIHGGLCPLSGIILFVGSLLYRALVGARVYTFGYSNKNSCGLS